MRTRALTAARRALLPVAVALLGLIVSSALAQSGGEIVIEPADGGEPVTLTLDDVDGSIDTQYPVRDAEGNTRRIAITPENGAAVDDFLKAAGLDEGYIYLEVGRHRLSRMRVRSGQGQDGLVPALYFDERGTHFVRPLMGPDDENESDIVTVPAGAFLIRQSVDSTLRLKVKASKRKIAAGKSVTFEAVATGGGIGDKFEYEWRFGDGSRTARTRVVEHTFDDAGSYRVKVSAGTADDIVHGGVKIEVGEPKESDVDREGGGTNDADGAPSSGSFDGDSGTGGYDTGSSGSFDYSTTDGYSPDPYEPVGRSAPATSGEPTVEGNLLADISTRPSAAAQAAARTGTPQENEPVDPAGVPTAAWALGGALALLGVGAGMESGRHGRRAPAGRPLGGAGRTRLRRLLRR
ncbi:MAG: PKD domain-containing protein [Thermoleophilaceae bacterium]